MIKKNKKPKKTSVFLDKLNDISLKLTDICFKYREDFPKAVDGVSVEIKHGEYVTIIGHNGSGKSTLSKIIIGVLTAQEGVIELFGNVVTNKNKNLANRFLGIVFQNPDNQFIGSCVRDDIAFGLENRCIDPKLMPDIINEAANRVGMIEFLDHEPLMLSGGQKQRVAIASALALRPDIIIFDEATSMLDPRGKREVKEIMVQLKETREKTIISITHDMDEIINADKVIVMNAGKMIKFGTPEEILQDHSFLQSHHLDIPFNAKIADELIKKGLKINQAITQEELVKQLCQK